MAGAMFCCAIGITVFATVARGVIGLCMISQGDNNWCAWTPTYSDCLLFGSMALTYLFLTLLPMIFLIKARKLEKPRVQPVFIGLVELLVVAVFFLMVYPEWIRPAW